MKVLLFFLLSLLVAIQSFSSVTVIPLSKTDKQSHDFPYVGQVVNINNFNSGSGTLVGKGRFVLTAKHALTHDSECDGMLLDSSNFVFILDSEVYFVSKVYSNGNKDIALMELEKQAPYFAEIYNDQSIIGQIFYGVGFGRGCSNPDIEKLDWNLPYGTKRIFRNRITGFAKNPISGWQLEFKLHSPDSIAAVIGEGMPGPGDSGGGCFFLDQGKLKLAAIIVSISRESPYKGYLVRIKDNIDWIEKIVGKTELEEEVNKKENGISFPISQSKMLCPEQKINCLALIEQANRKRKARFFKISSLIPHLTALKPIRHE